jgi:hypothetical protein
LLVLCLASTLSISNTGAATAEPQKSEIEGMIDVQAPQGFDPAAAPAGDE